MQGVPLRIAIGPKDLENGTVELARRDTLTKEVVALESLVDKVVNLMTEIQNNIFSKALSFRNAHITKVNTLEEFKDVLKNKTGFISAHWDGTNETEAKIKEITKATIRCIPVNNIAEEGKCIYSGNPSKQRVLFAKAY